MCLSGVHLLYGFTVPLVQLVVAATVFPAQRDAFLAIDLILARKRKGVLRDAASELGIKPSIADLPMDVWLLIKDELAGALWSNAEHALLRDYHDDPATTDECCDCEVWNELRAAALQKRRPNMHFTLQHVIGCNPCIQTLWDTIDVVELKDEHDAAITDMLSHFQLATLSDYLISYEEYASCDYQAVLPVIIPQYASAATEVAHMSPDAGAAFDTHSSLTLLPRFVTLPPDATLRFKCLTKFFPHLEPTVSCHDGDYTLKVEGMPARQAAELSLPGGEPAWGLWSWSRPCRYA